MKRNILLLLVATSVSASQLFGQGKASFGVRAGVNFQNITGKDAVGDKLDNGLTTGFNAGVNAEIPVGIDFYIQPGVLFSTKGAGKIDESDDKINLSYIEVPVNFLYKPELGTGHLILGFGPYAAFGIGGKYKPESGGDQEIEFKNKITAAQAISGDIFFKGFDAGANLLFGYETSSRFSVQLNAQLGLTEINPKIEGVSDKSSWKNTGFGISAGYRF